MSERKKPDAMETALRYLEHRARTEQQVRDSLRDAEYTQEEIDDCLDRLLTLHYVDDTEYALSYLRRSLEKRRGLLRYYRELKERGIDKDTAQKAVYLFEDEEDCDIKEIEYENASLEAARILEGRSIGEKERAKAGRRLASLGYDMSMIYSILGAYGRSSIDA